MASKATNQNEPKLREFFIFHRNGTCLLHLDFNLDENIIPTNKAINASSNKENEHRYKLLFGMLFSMKSFVKTLSPKKSFDYLKSFSTKNFKLHYVEFLNGLRFCLMTTPTQEDLGYKMRELHRLYTSLISKNIFYSQEEQIKNEIFLEQVTNYLKNINNTLL